MQAYINRNEDRSENYYIKNIIQKCYLKNKYQKGIIDYAITVSVILLH